VATLRIALKAMGGAQSALSAGEAIGRLAGPWTSMATPLWMYSYATVGAQHTAPAQALPIFIKGKE